MRVLVLLLAFAPLALSLALGIGSGATRFDPADEPALVWWALASFGVFLVFGLIARLVGPPRDPDARVPVWGWGLLGAMFVAALVAGIAIDLGN